MFVTLYKAFALTVETRYTFLWTMARMVSYKTDLYVMLMWNVWRIKYKISGWQPFRIIYNRAVLFLARGLIDLRW